MADQFTQIKTTGFGKRIGNSLTAPFIGIVLIVIAVVVLYNNEGRSDLAKLARTAKDIGSSEVKMDDFVSLTDQITILDPLGDGLFLKEGNYIKINRIIEIYAWEESTKTESNTNLGGSQTDETTYTYDLVWTTDPQDSTDFKYPEGHTNVVNNSIKAATFNASDVKVGSYIVNISEIDLPSLDDISLTNNQLDLTKIPDSFEPTLTCPKPTTDLASDGYIYYYPDCLRINSTPKVGDIRISYQALNSDQLVTVFGKLQLRTGGSEIVSYTDNQGNTLYRIFLGSRDQAIKTLHTEYVVSLWLLRLLGFVLMLIGISMITSPLMVLADFIPFAGKLARSVSGIISFVIASMLTILVIFISILIHNIVAVIVSLLIITVLIVVIITSLRKRQKSNS